jgi:hypothetical protein
MFEEQQGGEKQNALALAITRQASAQGVVDQIAAGIAAGEEAMAAEADPAVLGVLARRQAQQEQKLSDAKAALMAAHGEMQQLQTMPGVMVIAVEAQQQIRDLLQIFAGNEDSVDDRRAVQHHLGRIGLRVHVDGDERQLGLQIGEGEIDWQPLNGTLAQCGLAAGVTGGQYLEVDVPEGLGADEAAALLEVALQEAADETLGGVEVLGADAPAEDRPRARPAGR